MYFPSLGAELMSVRPKDVLPSGIDVLREEHDFPIPNKDRRSTFGSAAPGWDRGFVGCAVV